MWLASPTQSDIDRSASQPTHHFYPGGHRVLRVDLDDGGGAVLVLHVGVGIGGICGGGGWPAAVGVNVGGDVGKSAKELVGGGARRDAGRVCKLCFDIVTILSVWF